MYIRTIGLETLQIVKNIEHETTNCFEHNNLIIIPATNLLSQLV